MTEAKTGSDAPVAEGTSSAGNARPRRIIRPKQVVKRVNFGRVTLWRKASDPDDDFPAPVQLTGNLIGWFEDEIDAWLESRPRVSWASAKANRVTTGDPSPNHSQPDRAA